MFVGAHCDGIIPKTGANVLICPSESINRHMNIEFSYESKMGGLKKKVHRPVSSQLCMEAGGWLSVYKSFITKLWPYPVASCFYDSPASR